MQIQHIKSKSNRYRPVTVLTSERNREHESRVAPEKIKQIIALGYPMVSLEMAHFQIQMQHITGSNEWNQHSFGLIEGIPNQEYWLSDLDDIDLLIHKKYIPDIINQVWRYDLSLVGVSLASSDFSLSLVNVVDENKGNSFWDALFVGLAPFNWNLYFLSAYYHVTRIASPDPSLIEKIVDILDVPRSQITETECYL